MLLTDIYLLQLVIKLISSTISCRDHPRRLFDSMTVPRSLHNLQTYIFLYYLKRRTLFYKVWQIKKLKFSAIDPNLLVLAASCLEYRISGNKNSGIYTIKPNSSSSNIQVRLLTFMRSYL